MFPIAIAQKLFSFASQTRFQSRRVRDRSIHDRRLNHNFTGS
jgi:hypothetical protein